MRRAWIIAVALAVAGLAPGLARAGVYNTAEPWPLPKPFDYFHNDWATYRAAPVDLENRAAVVIASLTADACPQAPGVPLRLISSSAAQRLFGPADQSPGLRYLRQVRELEAREREGTLPLEGRINLGAYYLRLQQPQKAIGVLEPRAREGAPFTLWANLATAYEQAGLPDRALTARDLALKAWPATYPGWDSFQLRFYRKVEKYQLDLLKLRQKEAQRRPGRNDLRLDDLFPGVEFVGASGKYEAGGIAPAQWGEVPADALALVEQMLLWSPFDERLQWLLGELLNAGGDVRAAVMVLGPLVNKQQGSAQWSSAAPPELREHYRVLAAAYPAVMAYRNQLVTEPFLNVKLLCAFAPHGGLGAGDLMQEAIWPAWVIGQEDQLRRAQGATGSPPPLPQAPAPPSTPSASWLPDSKQLKQLAVAFVAGALVAWLLGQQFRQARRAKAARVRMEEGPPA
jgi:hypothetical protein